MLINGTLRFKLVNDTNLILSISRMRTTLPNHTNNMSDILTSGNINKSTTTRPLRSFIRRLKINLTLHTLHNMRRLRVIYSTRPNRRLFTLHYPNIKTSTRPRTLNFRPNRRLPSTKLRLSFFMRIPSSLPRNELMIPRNRKRVMNTSRVFHTLRRPRTRRGVISTKSYNTTVTTRRLRQYTLPRRNRTINRNTIRIRGPLLTIRLSSS